MARFVKHGPCPSCGSRDNLAEYDDGSSYCFGCHYYKGRQHIPNSFMQEEEEQLVQVPTTVTKDFPASALKFFGSVPLTTILRYPVFYDPVREQVLFVFYNKAGHPACIQARNLNPERAKRSKYYNVGDKQEVLPIYGQDECTTLVLTEDALSAMKVSEVVHAMPLLGTSITASKLAQLAKKYQTIIVWLDRDKWREAREIADKAKWMGLSAHSVFTPDDPKTYTTEKINGYLANAR